MVTRSTIVIRNRPSHTMAALTIASSLVLTTLASADELPVRQQSWPVPTRAVVAARVQAITNLAPALDFPFVQRAWPLPTLAVTSPVPSQFEPIVQHVEFPKPFLQTEWPNPLKKGAIWVSVSTAPGEFASPAEPEPDPPFVPITFPAARPKGALIGRDPIPNLLHSTLASASTDRPFSQAQWLAPVPRRVVGTRLGYVGFFVVDHSAPFVETSWPNPQRARTQPGLLTITTSRDLSASEPAKPFLLTEWPNPQGKGQSSELLKRAVSRDLSLIDVVDDTPQSLSDWPTPPRLQRSIELLTWAPSLLHSTLAPQATPFVPTEFPNPLTKARAVDLLTSTDVRRFYLTDEYPFSAPEWPNPIRRTSRETLTFSQALLESPLSVQQDPFVSTDRPNPAPRRYPTLTWDNNLLQGTLTPDPFPVVQSDWPVFRPTAPAIELRTWLQARPFYAEDATPSNQFEWPVPAPMRVAKGLGWWMPPQIGVLGQSATADVLIRIRADVGIIRVRPDPDIFEVP